MDISFDTPDFSNESKLDERIEPDYSTPKFFEEPIEDKIENKSTFKKLNLSKNNQPTLQLAQTINSGIEFGELGQHQKALECFDRAVQLDENNASVWGPKGLALFHLGRYEEAIVCFDRVITIDRNLIHVLHDKAAALSRLKRYDEAIVCFDKMLESDENEHYVLHDKGTTLFRLQKYEDAIVCFDRVIQLDDSNTRVFHDKGLALSELRRFEEAIVCFDTALENDKYQHKNLINKGKALASLRKFEEAIVCFDTALENNRYRYLALHYKAITLDELEKYEDAEKCYKEILENNKKISKLEIWFNRGSRLIRFKKGFEEAIVCLKKIPQTDKDEISNWNLKGNEFLKNKKFEEAIDCYNKVTSIDERYHLTLFRIAIHSSYLNKHDDAIEYFRKDLLLNNIRFHCYQSKAFALIKLAEKKAKERSDPNRRLTKTEIKRYRQESRDLLDISEEINDDINLSYQSLGNALYKIKRHEEAIDCYNMLIQRLGLQDIIEKREKFYEVNKKLNQSK